MTIIKALPETGKIARYPIWLYRYRYRYRYRYPRDGCFAETRNDITTSTTPLPPRAQLTTRSYIHKHTFTVISLKAGVLLVGFTNLGGHPWISAHGFERKPDTFSVISYELVGFDEPCGAPMDQCSRLLCPGEAIFHSWSMISMFATL